MALCTIESRPLSPTIMATKICLICKKEFSKPKKQSFRWWNKAKLCSVRCTSKYRLGRPSGMLGKIPWNKGKKTGHLPRSGFQMGHNPWNKGKGTTKGCDARTTRKFKDLRITVLIKASYKCSECGSIKGRLEVDHIKPVKFYPELVLDESNLRVLCRECHKNTPTYGKKVFNYEHAY